MLAPFHNRWARLRQRPFPRLVAHFAAVILQSGQDSGASELNLSIGGLLALLAAPGGFACLMLFDKYSSLLRWLRRRPQIDVYWASLPDKYFFIVFSMVVTGVVVAIKWDKILPGRQDYANLAPLPLRSRTVFFANLCAIILLASVFAADVNAVSSLLFPGVVLSEKGTFTEFAVFAAVHATCVILASAFTFFACFALMAILMSALPNRAFRAASLALRLAIIVSLIVMLCTSFAVLPAVRNLAGHPDSLVRYLPPVWYLALYQWMQGRATPELDALAGVALKALFGTAALALMFSIVSYRRYYMRIPESHDARQTERGWQLRWSDRWMRPLLRSPFQRACYRFSLHALMRSETHCILFGAFVGVGLVVASQMVMSVSAPPRGQLPDPLPGVEVLAAPLALAFFLVIGLRFVFEVPAGLNANWLYRLILGSTIQPTGAVAMKIILTFLIPGVVIPCLIAYWWAWNWRIGLVHAAFVLAMAVLLIDIVLLRFRKIPFTCTLPVFQNHALMLALIYFVGFFAFTDGGAAAERAMLERPALFAIVPVLIALGRHALRRIEGDTPDIDLQLLYEEGAAKEVQTLNIVART